MTQNNYLSIDSSGVYELAPVIKELNKESDSMMKDYVVCKALVTNKFSMDKIGHLTLDIKEGEYFYYPKLHASRSNGITVEIQKDSKKIEKELEGKGVRILSHLDNDYENKVKNTNDVALSKERKRKKALEEM